MFRFFIKPLQQIIGHGANKLAQVKEAGKQNRAESI
jgi:hypothetical protein